MKNLWVLQFLVLLCIVDCARATSPVLTIPLPTLSVGEKEAKRTKLTEGTNFITCTDADAGDLTRAYISSMSPSTPCTGCFALELCGNKLTEYCLTYQPSQGKFAFTQVDNYRVSIVCTDDTADPAATGTVEVAVVKNQQPVFTTPGFEIGTVGNTKDKTRGATLFSVLATDAEGDAMYFTMTSVPDRSDLFEIEYGSGVIRAKEDLRHLCSTPVTFQVYVKDDYNPRVGPKTIQLNFANRNDAPTIDNTKIIERIDEDENIGSEVFEIGYTDATIYLPPNNMGNRHPYFELTAEPKQGLDIYTVAGRRVEVRRQLDYEYAPLREVELTLRAFDGFCFSGEYKVTVVIENANEPFELFPDLFEITLNEGSVTYAPALTFRDPDVGETFTFTKRTGVSSGLLDVESSTGIIKSTGDITAGGSKSTTVSITVDVEDTGSHIQTFKVQITVVDINDNTSVFNPTTYDFTGIIDDCTEPGATLGKVTATDADSDRNGNNMLVFSGNVPGKYFSILSDGTVLLTKKMAAAQVVTGTAFVTDMGLPSPLQGQSGAVVTVTAGTCPTTPTPPTTPIPPTTTTPIPPTTPPPPTTTTQFTVPRNAKAEELLKASDTSSNARAGHSDSVGWMTTAAVAFVALVIILTVVLCLLCKPSGAGARKPVPQNTTQSYPNGKAPQNMPPQQYGKDPGQANPPLALQQQAALGATAAPYNPNRVSQDPLSPRQQPPNGASQSPYNPNRVSQDPLIPRQQPPNGASPSPYNPNRVSQDPLSPRQQPPNGASPSPFNPQPNGAAPKAPNPQQAKGPSPSSYSPRQPSPDGPGPNSSNPQQAESSNPQQQQSQTEPSKPRMIIPAVLNAPAPPNKSRVTMENDQPVKPQGKTDKNSPRKEAAKKVDKAKAEKAKGKTNAKNNNADQAEKPEKGKVNFAEYPLKPKMKVGENFDLEIITPRNSPLPYVQ